jgi:hypothetical protein
MPTTSATNVTTTSNPSAVSDDIDAYSIPEFCRRNSICRGTFYNMRAAGAGPTEKRAMGRVLITKEAALEWRLRQ